MVLVGMTACGGNDKASSSPGSASADTLPSVSASKFSDLTGQRAVEIDAKDNVFSPRYIKISKGTKVTFVNQGDVPHNVLPATDGAFAKIPTDDFGPGSHKSVTFVRAGTYAYYCSLHGTPTQGMNGRILVV